MADRITIRGAEKETEATMSYEEVIDIEIVVLGDEARPFVEMLKNSRAASTLVTKPLPGITRVAHLPSSNSPWIIFHYITFDNNDHDILSPYFSNINTSRYDMCIVTFTHGSNASLHRARRLLDRFVREGGNADACGTCGPSPAPTSGGDKPETVYFDPSLPPPPVTVGPGMLVGVSWGGNLSSALRGHTLSDPEAQDSLIHHLTDHHHSNSSSSSSSSRRRTKQRKGANRKAAAGAGVRLDAGVDAVEDMCVRFGDTPLLLVDTWVTRPSGVEAMSRAELVPLGLNRGGHCLLALEVLIRWALVELSRLQPELSMAGVGVGEEALVMDFAERSLAARR